MTRVIIELNTKRYRDDSYDRHRSRSRESSCLPKARKVDNKSKIEQVHKVIQQLSQDKQIALKLILDNSKDFEAMFCSIHSEANVDYLIENRIKYAQSQKAKTLAKDPHVNISNMTSQNYESINKGTSFTQESVNTEILGESNSDSNSEEGIQFLT